MENNRTIKSALISVFSKDGLEELVKILDSKGVKIYSTGGTQKFIENLGISIIPVEELTDYPSILGGRVKTLHPKVFGGILNRRTNQEDKLQLSEYKIPEIDLVVVDLYPFTYPTSAKIFVFWLIARYSVVNMDVLLSNKVGVSVKSLFSEITL